MREITALSLVLLPLLATKLLPGQAYRAAYAYEFGKAWSSGVELPSYDILDLGYGWIPLDVNDGGSVLMRNAANRLEKWTWGKVETLADPFHLNETAKINNRGTVVASYVDQGTVDFQFWTHGQSSGTFVSRLLPIQNEPHYIGLGGLNEMDQMAIRIDSSSGLFQFPEIISQDTFNFTIPAGPALTLASYKTITDSDFATTRGGSIYSVYGLNNYGDTVGQVFETSIETSTSESAYDQIYYSFNIQYMLDFQPTAISDYRSIIGVTEAPLAGMIILDRFGQRAIGPYIYDLHDLNPQISSPLDGLEEIVAGPHYFRRMSERDLWGNLIDTPSPDFWYGAITDVVRSQGGWTGLQATCISTGGRIAGYGWKFDPNSGGMRKSAFLLIDPLLVPDWDRNGKIDTADRQFNYARPPWRFWINDDDDDGPMARSSMDDLPGSPTPDWETPGMDGLRDAVDFFPVMVDLQAILRAIKHFAGFEIRIRQDDNALNLIYTNLHPADVGRIHKRNLPAEFGPAKDMPMETAPTVEVTAQGIALQTAFLEGIRDQGRSILLFEARAPTKKPLILEIKHSGKTILSSELPLSISPVRSMMRILNIRAADPKFHTTDGPWPTNLNEPSNLPDAHLESLTSPIRTLVHIHGFNWTGEEAPAAHTEVFKRFFQSGSNARFIGVTWRGDAGTLDLTNSSFEYNENVIHAFISAQILADELAPFSGFFTSIFAHSLGNMVTSSLLHDFQFQVGNYFIVNGAVPLEAYDGESKDRRHMVHPDWKDEGFIVPDYAEHLLSPNWYKLFPQNDYRSWLKWKSRFANVHTSAGCINFYSSGEDVLRTGTGDVPELFADVAEKEWVWVFNEMVKGTSTFAATLAGDVHAGWGFNRHYMDWVDPGGAAHPPPGSWVQMSTSDADFIDPVELIPEPFFRPFDSSDSDFPAWGDGSWLYGSTEEANDYLVDIPTRGAPMNLFKNHAKILAEGIPAHSPPVGSQPIQSMRLLDNVDLDKEVRHKDFWPHRDPSERRNRWLHSDYAKPALAYVIKLYSLCVNQINKMP